MTKSHVTILGAGAMGTALSVVLAKNGYDVVFWDIEKRVIEGINHLHKNPRSLTDIKLDKTARANADISKAVLGADMVVFATASHAVREVALSVKKIIARNCIVITIAKGLEKNTFKTMTQILNDTLDHSLRNQIMALSGPTLAPELAGKLPTAAVLASEKSNAYSKRAVEAFSTDWFTVSETRDVIGVELAGVSKHLLAIIAGILDGMNKGSNARGWLLSEGFREVSRLIWKLGGQEQTVYGLAGLGDTLATSFSQHSRNRQFGEFLGKGKPVDKAVALVGETVEGVFAAEALYELAHRESLQLPVIDAVHDVIAKKKKAQSVFSELLQNL